MYPRFYRVLFKSPKLMTMLQFHATTAQWKDAELVAFPLGSSSVLLGFLAARRHYLRPSSHWNTAHESDDLINRRSLLRSHNTHNGNIRMYSNGTVIEDRDLLPFFIDCDEFLHFPNISHIKLLHPSESARYQVNAAVNDHDWTVVTFTSYPWLSMMSISITPFSWAVGECLPLKDNQRDTCHHNIID